MEEGRWRKDDGRRKKSWTHVVKVLATGEKQSEKSKLTKGTKTGKQQTKYEVDGVIKEWSEFRSFGTFLVGLFFSVLPSLFDFTSDGLLAWEYIFRHDYVDETYDMKHVPPTCLLLEETSNKTSSSIFFHCEIEPRPILGVVTLIIPFLPGIQWYTSINTKQHKFKIWKFTSLLFPIFMVVFKVIEDFNFKNTTFLLQIGHLFIQGSHTKELMILMTTCETINESMVQLIFQLIIIMTGDANKRITTYQIMVVSFSFFMASKGPAEDYWAARMKREKKEAEAHKTKKHST